MEWPIDKTKTGAFDQTDFSVGLVVLWVFRSTQPGLALKLKRPPAFFSPPKAPTNSHTMRFVLKSWYIQRHLDNLINPIWGFWIRKK
jgi:hypothetical protein